ncbi:MAG: hypothetical protein WAX04_14140 [Oscillospiraceae bacterium]
MLGKLLKYEFKSTARMFLPFFGALLVLAILNKIFFFTFENVGFLAIPRSLFMALYVFMIIATFIMTLVVTIQRFYKNLLSDEGYLMFTLPVKTSQQILSKGIVAYVWVLACILSTFLSIFIMLPDYSWIRQIPEGLRLVSEQLYQYTGMRLSVLFVETIALCLIGLAAFILQVYTAISIGQLSNKHKVLASFGAYVAIYAIIQIIMSIAMTVLGLTTFDSNFDHIDENVAQFVQLIIGISLAIDIILSAGYFFLTKYILKNKLNLE